MSVRGEDKEFHARSRTCAHQCSRVREVHVRIRDMPDTRDVISIGRFGSPLLHALLVFYRGDAITLEHRDARAKAGRQPHFDAPKMQHRSRHYN